MLIRNTICGIAALKYMFNAFDFEGLNAYVKQHVTIHLECLLTIFWLRRKNKAAVNLKTGCFNNINSAVIVRSVKKAMQLFSILYCLPCTGYDDSWICVVKTSSCEIYCGCISLLTRFIFIRYLMYFKFFGLFLWWFHTTFQSAKVLLLNTKGAVIELNALATYKSINRCKLKPM